MEKFEDRLYSRLSRVKIADTYAKAFEEEKVLTNINELFRTSAKDELLRRFSCDEKYISHAISDFEYFSDFCRLLPSLTGTLVGELAKEELSLLYRNSGNSFDSLSDEQIASLWREGNRMLSESGGKYLDFLSNFGVEKSYTRETLPHTFDCVEKCYQEGELAFLFADVSALPFVRPDPYHASLAKDALANGKTLGDEEKAVLIFQTLYELFFQSTAPISCLRLLPDASGETARALIEYLGRMGASVSIRLAADGSVKEEILLSLCALSDAHVDVTLELVLGATDSRLSLYHRLCRLSAIYPLSQLRFGGVRTDSPLFFAGHRHVVRVLSRVLSEIASVEEEAERLGMQILGA